MLALKSEASSDMLAEVCFCCGLFEDDEDEDEDDAVDERAAPTLPGHEMTDAECERIARHLEAHRELHATRRKLWGGVVIACGLFTLFAWITAAISADVTTAGVVSGLIGLGVGGLFGWRLWIDMQLLQRLESDHQMRRKHTLEGTIRYKDERPVADGMRYALTLNDMTFDVDWEDFNAVRFNDPARIHVGALSRAVVRVESLKKRRKKTKKKRR